MNVAAILLTGVLFLVLIGGIAAVGHSMTWALRYESQIFRAIRKRSDPTEYRSDHDDE